MLAEPMVCEHSERKAGLCGPAKGEGASILRRLAANRLKVAKLAADCFC
jgi:hypothetical protein